MAKDKLKFELNPITGELDLVKEFNPDRILSHSLNPAGNKIMQYDPISATYFEAGPEIVFDNDGNVVTT